ncbi:MAG: hypothetical protein WKF52_03925 [Sphingomicrobium sp.]
MDVGVGWQSGAAEPDRGVERQPNVLEAVLAAPAKAEIAGRDRLGADIEGAELGEELRPGGATPAAVAGHGDFDQGRPGGAPDRAFDEGHPFVVDQHRPSQHPGRRAFVDAMLGRNCRLQLGKPVSFLRRLQGGGLAPRLVEAGPVPGLAGRDVILTDIEAFVAGPNLPLRAVKDDAEVVLAVEKLNIFKGITLPTVRSGKGKQLSVTVQLGLPPRREVAFEAGPVEAAGVGDRPVGDHCAAAADR